MLGANIKEEYKKLKNILRISFSFAKTNFKLRNEGSYLGILWYLLEPLLFLLILPAITGRVLTDKIPNYSLYLFLGLIMFNFFMNVTTASASAITSKGKFVKNMTIPKESLVLSTPIQFIFSHIIEIAIFTGLMIRYGVSLSALVYYPIIFAVLLIFVIGCSFILATIGVFVSDLKNAWAAFSRILWFITPIYYAASVKGWVSKLNYINPMTHFLNIARNVVIYHQTPNLRGCLLVLIISVATLAIGIWIFNKYKNKFAEEM